MCCQGDDLSAPNDGPLRNDALHGLWLVPLAMVNISDSKTHIFFTLFVIFIISLVQFLSHFIIFIKKKGFSVKKRYFRFISTATTTTTNCSCNCNNRIMQQQQPLPPTTTAAAAAVVSITFHLITAATLTMENITNNIVLFWLTSRRAVSRQQQQQQQQQVLCVHFVRSFVRLLVRMTQYVMRRPTKTAASRKLHSRHSRSSAHIKSSRRISNTA